MIKRLLLSGLLCGSILLGGCAGNSTRASFTTAELPDPIIADAYFKVGSNETLFVKGLYFKEHSDYKSDVVVSINCRNWAPAKKITDSSGTSYTFTSQYGPEFAQVWVRVYGINEHYSEPFLVHVKGN